MDKSELREMTSGEAGLKCYRCKDAPAVLVRDMHTPNGSTYLRGWCMPCVDGRPFKELERIGSAPSPGEESEETQRPFKVGARVSVHFEAVVLHYGVGSRSKDVVFVRRGTMAYEVPMNALCALVEEESNDAGN